MASTVETLTFHRKPQLSQDLQNEDIKQVEPHSPM